MHRLLRDITSEFSKLFYLGIASIFHNIYIYILFTINLYIYICWGQFRNIKSKSCAKIYWHSCYFVHFTPYFGSCSIYFRQKHFCNSVAYFFIFNWPVLTIRMLNTLDGLSCNVEMTFEIFSVSSNSFN